MPTLLWQAAEVGYFLAIWAYLITTVAGPHAPGGIGTGLYFAALLARFGTVALLAGLVVRDILRPQADVVRRDGEDDPAGGVLSGAPDRFVLKMRLGLRQASPADRVAPAGPLASPDRITRRPRPGRRESRGAGGIPARVAKLSEIDSSLCQAEQYVANLSPPGSTLAGPV